MSYKPAVLPAGEASLTPETGSWEGHQEGGEHIPRRDELSLEVTDSLSWR